MAEKDPPRSNPILEAARASNGATENPILKAARAAQEPAPFQEAQPSQTTPSGAVGGPIGSGMQQGVPQAPSPAQRPNFDAALQQPAPADFSQRGADPLASRPSTPEIPEALDPLNQKRADLFRGYASIRDKERAVREEHSAMLANYRTYRDQGMAGSADELNKRLSLASDEATRYGDIKKQHTDYFQEQLDRSVAEDVDDDVNSLTMDRQGLPVADPTKVREKAERFAAKYGLSKDQEFIKDVQNRMDSRVRAGVLKPRVDKLFDEEKKKIIGEEGDKVWKGFTTDSVEYAHATEAISDLQKQASSGAKEEIDATFSRASTAANAITEQWKAQEDEALRTADAVKAQFDAGQLSADAANQILAQVDQKNKDAFAQYTTSVKAEQETFLTDQNKILSRYNRRLDEQQKAILKDANTRVQEAAAKHLKEYEGSPEAEAARQKLNAAYEKAWKTAAQERGKAEGVAANVRYNLASSALGPIAAMGGRFMESTVAGLGGAFKGMATTVGSENGYVLGQEMERAFLLPEARSKEFADLLDPANVSQLSGQLLGGMTPSVVAAATVSGITGGAGAPVAAQLVASSLAAWGAETLDISGRMKDDVFRDTRDMDKANDAAWKSFRSQVQLLPTYAFEGLPFVKGFLKAVPTRALRVGTGAAIEYGTEVLQEVPQNIAEKNIRAGKDPWEGFAEELDRQSKSGELRSTLIGMAPITLLGGAGQATGTSAKQDMLNAAKSYAAKAKVDQISASGGQQWMNGMVKARGEKFARAVISSMYTGGSIDEATAKKFIGFVDENRAINGEAKALNIPGVHHDAYVAFSADYADLSAKAEAETSPLAKAVLTQRANEAKKAATEIAAGNGEYVTVKYPDGTTTVLAPSQAAKLFADEEFLSTAAITSFGNNGLTFTANGEEAMNMLGDFQERSMERLDEIKQGKREFLADAKADREAKANTPKPAAPTTTAAPVLPAPPSINIVPPATTTGGATAPTATASAPTAKQEPTSNAVASVFSADEATGVDEEPTAALTGVPEGGVPVSTEAAILSRDQQAASERRIDDMDAARVIAEQLSRGKKLAYGTRGDGSVYAGHDVGERQQIKLDMTQEERREFRNAEDDLKFASTPDERTAANARIQAALIEPTKRRIAQINEGSTTTTEAPAAQAPEDTGDPAGVPPAPEPAAAEPVAEKKADIVRQRTARKEERKQLLKEADNLMVSELGPVGAALRYIANGGKFDQESLIKEFGWGRMVQGKGRQLGEEHKLAKWLYEATEGEKTDARRAAKKKGVATPDFGDGLTAAQRKANKQAIKQGMSSIPFLSSYPSIEGLAESLATPEDGSPETDVQDMRNAIIEAIGMAGQSKEEALERLMDQLPSKKNADWMEQQQRDAMAEEAAAIADVEAEDVLLHMEEDEAAWNSLTDEQKHEYLGRYFEDREAADEAAGEAGKDPVPGRASDATQAEGDKERQALADQVEEAKAARVKFEKDFKKRAQSLFDTGEVQTRKEAQVKKAPEPGLFAAEGDTRATGKDDFAKAVKPYDDAVASAEKALDEYDNKTVPNKQRAAAAQTTIPEASASDDAVRDKYRKQLERSGVLYVNDDETSIRISPHDGIPGTFNVISTTDGKREYVSDPEAPLSMEDARAVAVEHAISPSGPKKVESAAKQSTPEKTPAKGGGMTVEEAKEYLKTRPILGVGIENIMRAQQGLPMQRAQAAAQQTSIDQAPAQAEAPLPKKDTSIDEKRTRLAEVERKVGRISKESSVGVPEYRQKEWADLHSELATLRKDIAEYERPERERRKAEEEAARMTALDKKAAEKAERVRTAPVFQRRNGWEIVKDGVHYVLRNPFTKEELNYHQSLTRVREWADEEKPQDDSTPTPTTTEAPADAQVPVASPAVEIGPVPPHKKGKLIATGSTLDGVKKKIAEYYMGSIITLNEQADGTYSVSNKKGLIEGVEVIPYKGGFRFQETAPMGKAEAAARKAAAALEKAKLKPDQLYALPLPPSVWNGAITAMQEVIIAGGKAADAIAAAIKHIQNSDWWKNKATQKEKDEVMSHMQGRISDLEAAVAAQDVANLKQNIQQARATGAQKTRTKQQEARKEFVQAVKDSLDPLRGRLTPAQVTSITTRAARVNPASPQSVAKFERVAEKIIAKANYANDLQAARKTAKRIKSKVDSDAAEKKVSAEQALAVRDFLGVDPSEVADIDRYNDIANRVLKTLEQVKVNNGEVLNESFAITNKDLSAYSTEELKRQQDIANADLKAEYADLKAAGLVGAMTEEEYIALQDAINDEELSLAAQARAEEKLDSMRRFVSWKQQFWNDQGAYDSQHTFTAREQRAIDTIRNADVSKLDLPSLVKVNTVMNNVMENGDTSDLSRTAAIIEGIQNRENTLKLGLKDMKQNLRSAIENFAGNAERLIGAGAKKAAELRWLSGIDEVLDLGVQSQKRADKFAKDTLAKKKELGIAKEDTRTNRARMFVYNLTQQHYGGTQTERQQVFEEHKAMIEEDIRLLQEKKSLTQKEEHILDSATKAYDELLKGSNSAAEVSAKMAQKYPQQKKLADWIVSRYDADLKKKVFDSAKLDNNMNPEEVFNYGPRVWHSLRELPTEKEVGEVVLQERLIGRGVDKRPTGSKFSRTGRPKDSVLSYDFIKNMQEGYSESDWDASTAHARNVLAEFFRGDQLAKEIGSDAAQWLRRTVVDMLAEQRGLNDATDKDVREVMRVANRLRKIGRGIALKGVAQWVKQPTVLTNTWANLGRDALSTFSFIDMPNGDKLREQFQIAGRKSTNAGYDKLVRRIHGGVAKEDMAKGTEAARHFVQDVGTAILDRGESLMETFVSTPDVWSANLSWNAFYKQSLKDQGVDLKSHDFSKEWQNPNKQAASYANQQVERLQGSNSAATMARIYRDGGARVILSQAAPFSSFALNMRMRILRDTNTLLYGAKEDKREAGKALAGTMAEQLVFQAAKTAFYLFVTKQLVEAALSALDLGDDDEERKKKEAERTPWRDAGLAALSDFTLGGTTQFVQSSGQQAANWAYRYLKPVETNKDGNLVGTKDLFFQYPEREGEWGFLKYMGEAGVAFRTVNNIMNKISEMTDSDLQVTKGGTNFPDLSMSEMKRQTDAGLGTGPQVRQLDESLLTNKEAALATISILFDMAALVGYSEQNINSVNNAVWKEVKKSLDQKQGKETLLPIVSKPKTDDAREERVKREEAAPRVPRRSAQ